MRVLILTLIPLLPAMFLACTHPAPSGLASGERAPNNASVRKSDEAIQARIRVLVAKLQSADDNERKMATEQLRKHLERAVPELTKAAGAKHSEFSKSAREVLGAIAEDRFFQMRKSIQDAKTLKIVFSARISKGFGAGYHSEGTVLLKESEKVNMHVKTRYGGKEGWYTYISDGIRAYTSQDRSPAPHIGRASGYEARCRKHALLFFGCQYYATVLQPLTSKVVAEIGGTWTDPGYSVEHVSKNTFCLKYSFAFLDIFRHYGTGTFTGHVAIWYDAESGKILKFIMRYGSDEDRKIPTTEYSETYEHFLYDAHIPDENFVIPEER